MLAVSLLLYTLACKQTDSPPAEPDTAQTVYVGNTFGGNLYAFDAQTGAKKWETLTNISAGSAPVYASGIVYVGGDKVYAIDAETGTPKWEKALGSSIDLPFVNCVPTVANRLVYVVVAGFVNKLFALDAQTGELKWQLGTGGYDSVSPTVANGLVYTGVAGKLFAVDAFTGEKKWEVTGLWGRPYNPSVVDGVVYTNCGSKMYAHDALTGEQKWVTDAGGNGPPTVSNGLIYVLGGSGIEVINATTGKYMREYARCLDVRSYPTVANSLLFVGGGSCTTDPAAPTYSFYGWDAATSALKWTQTFPYRTAPSPTWAAGLVFMGTDGIVSSLYALDAASGAIRWEARLGAHENRISPACVVSRQGKIYYSANSGDQP